MVFLFFDKTLNLTYVVTNRDGLVKLQRNVVRLNDIE